MGRNSLVGVGAHFSLPLESLLAVRDYTAAAVVDVKLLATVGWTTSLIVVLLTIASHLKIMDGWVWSLLKGLLVDEEEVSVGCVAELDEDELWLIVVSMAVGGAGVEDGDEVVLIGPFDTTSLTPILPVYSENRPPSMPFEDSAMLLQLRYFLGQKTKWKEINPNKK
eukprot:m.193102 g.193102  ORF g.193102 m.193102 type:complete len:167 (+) comp13655_c2_seq3:340-840(+)